MTEPEPDGVWVVYYNDMGEHITGIHRTELEALDRSGFYNVKFVEWGDL